VEGCVRGQARPQDRAICVAPDLMAPGLPAAFFHKPFKQLRRLLRATVPTSWG